MVTWSVKLGGFLSPYLFGNLSVLSIYSEVIGLTCCLLTIFWISCVTMLFCECVWSARRFHDFFEWKIYITRAFWVGANCNCRQQRITTSPPRFSDPVPSLLVSIFQIKYVYVHRALDFLFCRKCLIVCDISHYL